MYRVLTGSHIKPATERALGVFFKLEHAVMFLDALIASEGARWVDECPDADIIAETLRAEIRSLKVHQLPWSGWAEWHDTDWAYPQLFEVDAISGEQ